MDILVEEGVTITPDLKKFTKLKKFVWKMYSSWKYWSENFINETGIFLINKLL